MNQAILFPDRERWDEGQACIYFPVLLNGVCIECSVKRSWFVHQGLAEPDSSQSTLDLFKACRFDVEEAIEHYYRRNTDSEPLSLI